MIQNGLNPMTWPLVLALVTSLVYIVGFLLGFMSHIEWSERGGGVFSDLNRVAIALAGAVAIVSGLALVLQGATTLLGPMEWTPESFLACVAGVCGQALLVLALRWCVRQRQVKR